MSAVRFQEEVNVVEIEDRQTVKDKERETRDEEKAEKRTSTSPEAAEPSPAPQKESNDAHDVYSDEEEPESSEPADLDATYSDVAFLGNTVMDFGETMRLESTERSEGFSEKEVRYFKKMFDMFDTDNSGAIGFFEMKNLTRHLGVELSDEKLKKSMDAIDENGSGDLEFEEFLTWLSNVNSTGDEFGVLKSKIRAQGTRPLTNTQIEQLRDVFNHFDTDGSGSIDVEELGNVFKSMGQSLSGDELKLLMSQADDDMSGEIDFDEFMLLMCSSFGTTHSFDGDLIESFHKYDPTKSGMISCADLSEMIRELVGPNLDEDEVRDVIDIAHERGDGFVEYMKWEALWDACRGIST